MGGPTTPPVPAFVVAFASDTLRVGEGETVEVAIRYQVNDLTAPLALAVSPLDLGVGPTDYDLSATTFEIPAGQSITGTAALSVTALVDDQIAEGEEILGLRMVPPEGIRAQLDQNLEIAIVDVGALPCPGVRIVAVPVEPLASAPNWRQTTIELQQTIENDPAWIEWGGPFRHDENCDDEDCRTAWEVRTPILEVNLVDWWIEASAAGTKDFLQVEWFSSKTLRFGVRSSDGVCDRAPGVVCHTRGCELVR